MFTITLNSVQCKFKPKLELMRKTLRHVLNTFIVNYVPETPTFQPTGKAFPRSTNVFLQSCLHTVVSTA